MENSTPELAPVGDHEGLLGRKDLETMFRIFFPCTEMDIRRFATKTFIFSAGIHRHIQEEAKMLGVSTCSSEYPVLLFVDRFF